MENKPKFKFNCNDDLIIYESEQFPEGAVARIVDRSLDNHSTYLVVTLQDLGLANGDMGRVYAEMSSWVHQDDCTLLSYSRPKPWWKFW